MTPKPHPSPTALREAHHTTRYRTSVLILRQGLPLPLTHITAPLRLTLHPAHPNSTSLPTPIPITSDTATTATTQPSWNLTATSDVHTLHIPFTAAPGLYTLHNATDEPPLLFILLFNPYHPSSIVYLPSPEERAEYVEGVSGRLFVGSHSAPSSLPWNYSPFHPTTLLVSLHLLDSLPISHRSNPLHVLRHLSALLNSQDNDAGLLVGNWSGDYSHGTHPSAWTGSLSILTEYWRHLKPVRFAQCWVYAAVFTSVLRGLGIASMPVTNFSSAHESTRPYNRVVEYYYTHDGRMEERRSGGSVWNFHVWTMAWATRDDLEGDEWDGWQVVDGTPQEMSAGMFRAGPAPVAAVKKGVEVDFDVDFVVGEVNADLVRYWEREEGSGKYVAWKREQREVGRMLSVKAVGKDERRDVTAWYKYPEGSDEERAAFFNRPSHGVELQDEVWDVRMVMLAPAEVELGRDVEVDVVAESGVAGEVRVGLRCVYGVTDYTGRMVEEVGTVAEEVVVKEDGQRVMRVVVAAREYERALAGGMSNVLVKCAARVAGSGERWADEAVVRVNVDRVLEVRVAGEARVGRGVGVMVRVVNYTLSDLTGVVLLVEGDGMGEVQRVEVEDLGAGEESEVEVEVVPMEVGDRLLVVSLDTNELRDVVRSVHVQVKDSLLRTGMAALERHVWDRMDKDELVELADIHNRFGV